MKIIVRHAVAICALSMAFATSAVADPAPPPAAFSSPTVGIGLTLSFGRGGVDTGVGLRVFSGNRRDETVASAGIDYMFGSQRWRGTLGVAQMGNNSYIGLDLGIGLTDGALDFGLGAGAVNTRALPGA